MPGDEQWPVFAVFGAACSTVVSQWVFTERSVGDHERLNWGLGDRLRLIWNTWLWLVL